MNMNKLKMMAAALSAATVVACGGGGEVAGDSAEFTLFPAEFAWKVADSCPRAGLEQWITVNGGQPPYRIRNPVPTYLQIDRTEVSGKDPVFKVTTLGGLCGEVVITVLDYHSQTATLEITLEEPDDSP